MQDGWCVVRKHLFRCISCPVFNYDGWLYANPPHLSSSHQAPCLFDYLFNNHICHSKEFPSGGHLIIPMNIHRRKEVGF
jgi:hypothetical protein